MILLCWEKVDRQTGTRILRYSEPLHIRVRAKHHPSATFNPHLAAADTQTHHRPSTSLRQTTPGTKPNMPSQEPEPEAVSVPILFRPAKRRKIFRHQRSEDTADDQTTSTPEALPTNSSTDPTPPSDDDADEEAHIARLRHAARKRRGGGGVAFRAGGPSGTEESSSNNTERGMVLHKDSNSNGQQQDEDDEDEDSLILGGINRRFAPQTGLVGELVNRHM